MMTAMSAMPTIRRMSEPTPSGESAQDLPDLERPRRAAVGGGRMRGQEQQVDRSVGEQDAREDDLGRHWFSLGGARFQASIVGAVRRSP